MKIETTALYLPGNIHTRRLALELRLEGAEGVFYRPEDLRRLARALSFIRKPVRDMPAWRRLMRAEGDVPAAAVIELLAVVIQRYAYWPVRFCSWRPQEEGAGPSLQAKGRAVFEIGSEGPGREAGRVAVTLAAALGGTESAEGLRKLVLSEMAGFLKKTLRETPSADALHLAQAGQRRVIPWTVLHRSQYLRMGMGRNAHVLYGTESTNTTSIARAISRDKALSNRLLVQAGLPVARQNTARSEQEAQAHARAMGFPLVIKPLDGNMGRGVTVGVQDAAQVARAFKRAQAMSRDVVLETMIAGDETRILVVNGKMIAAVRRHPAQVCGDGIKTVRELVDQANQQPERELLLTGRMAVMKPIQMDDEALELLASQSLSPEAVVAEGQIVLLRRESNISRGGHPEDVRDLVHPSVRRVAEKAAAVVGLDVCGVDFITTDISRHWRRTGGAICEINSRPGINMHLYIAGAQAGQITGAFVDMLFPKDRPARLPVVALLGEPEETRPLRRSIEAVAARANLPLAVLTAESERDSVLPSSRWAEDVTALAWDTVAEAAVIEITPRRLVREGLGLDHVDLALLPAATDRDAGRALAALHRVAGPRSLPQSDETALVRALEALGLPSTGILALPPADKSAPARVPAKHEADPDEFTALFVGDLGFGESYMHHPRTAGLQQLLARHGHDYALAGLRPLLGTADLAVGNLEVPLAGRPDIALQGRKKYLGWSDAARSLAALKDAGFDAVTLANNHALDCGTSGLAETMMRLQDGGIAHFGAGRDAEAAALPFIHRFTTGGVERSLVVYGGFEHRARYQDRYRWYADRGFAGVAKINPARIARSVAALRAVLPNPVFIAYPHWGTDYEPVTESQRDTAKALAAAGVDLVIGHGTHCLQEAELIGNCPVLYNIGNFVWNTPGRYNKRDVPPFGLAVGLVYRRNQRGGPALRLYPVMTDNAVTGFQNRPVSAEEYPDAARVLTAGLPRRLRRGKEGAFPYLEMKLPLAVRSAPAARAATAADKSATGVRNGMRPLDPDAPAQAGL